MVQQGVVLVVAHQVVLVAVQQFSQDRVLQREGGRERRHGQGYVVNGLHLYSAYIQSASQNCTFIHSTHSHTDGGVNHARGQPASREQLGLLRDTVTLG